MRLPIPTATPARAVPAKAAIGDRRPEEPGEPPPEPPDGEEPLVPRPGPRLGPAPLEPQRDARMPGSPPAAFIWRVPCRKS